MEAVANIASLYNAGNFTATNMNITGTLTVNGVPITGSGTTLTIPNITTGAIGSSSVVASGNVTSTGLITGAIRASGDINGSSLTTAGTLSAGPITANSLDVQNGGSINIDSGNLSVNGPSSQTFIGGIMYYCDGKTSGCGHFTSTGSFKS